MEEKYEIVSFIRTQMPDFYDWVLPDVYAELLGVEDFADEGVIAVGALRDGEPCGAAVCVFTDAGVFSLISIMMDEAERRQGGGRLLLDAAVNEALRLTDWEMTGQPVKKLELRTEYVMREDEIADMDRFLSAYGFRDFTDMPPVYLYNVAIGRETIRLTPLTDFPDEEAELYAALEESDLAPDPELSFCVGDAQDTPLVFVTNPAGDSTYFVTSGILGEIGQEDFGQAFLSVLKKIGDTDADATVIAPATAHTYADVLERLARESGTVCSHRQASCYILLQAEGNE